MKYKSLSDLKNPYPSPESYRVTETNIILSGIFEKNQRKFKLPSLSQIKVVEDTSFNFIIQFFKEEIFQDDEEATEPEIPIGYWTSEVYYNLLRTARLEGNPYYKPDTFPIVKVYVKDFVHLIQRLSAPELQLDLQTDESMGIPVDSEVGTDNFDYNTINYDVMVKYIDWLVTKPQSFDFSLYPSSALAKIRTIEET